MNEHLHSKLRYGHRINSDYDKNIAQILDDLWKADSV